MRKLFIIVVLTLTLFCQSLCASRKKTDKKIPIKERVEAIYRRVEKCLQLTSTLTTQQFSYDPDLENHYKDVLAVTAQFRGLPPHNGSYYPGPWIENLFIRDFINRPFSYFNGIIPLFVQWSDYHLHCKKIKNPATKLMYTEEEIFQNVSSILRKNVLYMVVSQANYGIDFLMTKHPNVLIFGAGGEGDVPIPLIKGELPFHPLGTTSTFPKYDVGFYGSVDHGHRKKMLMFLQDQLRASDYTYRIGPSKTWIEDMSYTLFNLAPMGMGRASFRLAEIIQLGRIPVYLYEDFPWTPYEGTGFGPGDLGYLIKSNDVASVLHVVRSATNQSIAAKMQKVREARSLYTYEGLLDQIEKWFRDPFGPTGGLLRCKGGDRKDLLVASLGAIH